MPTSTSGHTGIHSTRSPRTSTRKASRLCPPSHRTRWPSRHEETPTLGFFPAIAEHPLP